MKNTIGTSVCVTLFGESHGKAIGAVIDGLAPGIDVDESYIGKMLSRRRPSSGIDTARQERDEFDIVSGVFQGKTTGAPITIIIPNSDTKSSDYEKTRFLARPSHADYSAYMKYHGYEDYRGGGHFSGRITAPIVAAGAIMMRALENVGIKIGTHILCCADVYDREFGDTSADIDLLAKVEFPVLDESKSADMTKAIMAAKSELDSVGGIVQTAVTGMPAGVGEPWFDSVEGDISRAMFAIGGVKGIEFGAGFAFAGMRASDSNDMFRVKDGKIITSTNHNGGINGGITNGMPIIFNLAVKPTPSVARVQETIDMEKCENADIEIKGRHDPAIVRRICPVVEAMTAIVLCDLLAQRYGTDVFLNGIK